VEIGALLLGIVIVGVTLYLVAEPFIFTAPRQYRGQVVKGEALEQEKEILFSALSEIEFDYRMGKLSEEDYQHLQTVYRSQAVLILQQEYKALAPAKATSEIVAKAQPVKTPADIEREIEAEVEKEMKRLKEEQIRRKKN